MKKSSNISMSSIFTSIISVLLFQCYCTLDPNPSNEDIQSSPNHQFLLMSDYSSFASEPIKKKQQISSLSDDKENLNENDENLDEESTTESSYIGWKLFSYPLAGLKLLYSLLKDSLAGLKLFYSLLKDQFGYLDQFTNNFVTNFYDTVAGGFWHFYDLLADSFVFISSFPVFLFVQLLTNPVIAVIQFVCIYLAIFLVVSFVNQRGTVSNEGNVKMVVRCSTRST